MKGKRNTLYLSKSEITDDNKVIFYSEIIIENYSKNK